MVYFSILITTYNRLALLKRAVNSALSQTVPCEVIVIDDYSTDGTMTYLSELGEKVVFYQNYNNCGHSESVNRGVQLAKGDWIKLLDDDDYLAPNCLEIMLQEITQHPEVVLCSCQAVQLTENGVELEQTRQISSLKSIKIKQEDIHYKMLLEQLPFGTPVQVAFCKKAFIKSGGWNSSFDLVYDDIDSWSRIAQWGDAIFINQCLAYRTVWSGGYNQRFSIQKRLEAHIEIKKKIYLLVHEKYRDVLPPTSDIFNYLSLHWGLIALKNGQIVTFWRTAFPAFLSVRAWKNFYLILVQSSPIIPFPTWVGHNNIE